VVVVVAVMVTTISEIIGKLQEKTDLGHEEINYAMTCILSGNTTLEENMEFLSSLADKGETDDELLGMLDKMQELSLKIGPETGVEVIDMCGTGGDRLQTFNISTAASFVVAAAGGRVAKHGNRSSSGALGSADIFEYFGYDLDQEPVKIAKTLEKHNICFMFAQKFHPAIKCVGPARRQIGRKTAFNLLGPLSNPANVKNQLVGVFSTEYLDRLPAILKRRGARNIMTVRSNDGMDEFSTSSANRVCTLRDNRILTSTIDPETLGLHKSNIRDIQISTRDDAIDAFVGVLNNTANKAMIETCALNAAGGLIVANKASGFEEAVQIALKTIDSGAAFRLLENFVQDTGDISRLRGIVHG